jgi:hypothetical protein
MGALGTTMPALSEAAGGFAPAEDLFDPSAGLLAEGVRIQADAHAQGSALRTGRRMRSHTAITDALDRTERVIRRNHRLQVKKARHTHLAVLYSPHPTTPAIAMPETVFSVVS